MLFVSIVQDMRYALRSMRSSIGLTTVAILSLGLGIGATIAIFSVMYALMFKPLPFAQPERLVEVTRSGGVNLHSYALWKQLRDKEDVFSDLLAYYAWDEQFNLANGGENQEVPGLYVSGGFFQTLGVPAILGRTLTKQDDEPGAVPVCVLGYGLWRRLYGQSQSILGRTVALNGHGFRVVGVAPRTFFGVEVGKRPELFLPLEMQRVFQNQRWPNGVPKPTLDASNALAIIGRLKPGVTVSQADAWLRLTWLHIEELETGQSFPAVKQTGATLVARPLPSGMSRSYFSNTILLLITMAGVALLIACANLGNLLLARATRRQSEIATRLALGATRRRLIRQLLTESIALSFAGTALGLLIKQWGGQMLLWVISFPGEETVLDLSWDSKLIVFTVGLTLLCALLFGLAPAVRATRIPLYSAMQNSWTTGNSGNRLPNAVLVIVQVALSMTLLVSAGLLVRTLNALLAKDPGYEAKGVLVVQANSGAINESPQRQAFEGDQLLEAFRSVPGVTSASWMANFSRSTLAEISMPQSGGSEHHTRWFRFFVSSDFFKTRRTPILAGRDFDLGDNGSSIPVAIISEQAAKTFFRGSSPIGLSFRESDTGARDQEYSVKIVGIAKDIDFQPPNLAPLFVFFRPISQCSACLPMGRYEIRFIGSMSDLVRRVKRSAANVDSNLDLAFHPLSEEIDSGVQQNRSVAWFSTIFSIFAGLLAMIGVYGVTSYTASQRTREIGIRMALGAQRTDVFWMLLRETIIVVFVGIALGMAAGYDAAKALRRLLWGVTPADPLTFVFAASLMVLVAGIAAFLSVRRSTRVDPMICLRYD